MDEQILNQKIMAVESTMKDDTLEDGITILAATLSAVIVGAVQDNQFDRNKIHDFFREMESRISKALNLPVRNKKMGIRRGE